MRKRVLVAEDEPNIAESLSFLLERAGYDVSVVGDGEAAVRAAADAAPDLLVLDLMLPGMDGYGVLRALRADERTAGLRVLILTAKGQSEDREAALEAGADGFITKPFANADLIGTIERLSAG